MLSNFQQPTSLSFGSPIEGVQTVQGFTTAENLNTLIPSFKLPEKGGKPEDEKKKKSTPSEVDDETEYLSDNFPELLQLVMNVSFQEMIKFFLKPNHKEIANIRNKFLQSRNEKLITIISPTGIQPKKFERLRKQLYLIQFQLFKTSKGLHCHVIV